MNYSVLEINFPVPIAPPGKEELNFTREIKQGKHIHRGKGVEMYYEIDVDFNNRMVLVTETTSGEMALYPFETVCRMRVEVADAQ